MFKKFLIFLSLFYSHLSFSAQLTPEGCNVITTYVVIMAVNRDASLEAKVPLSEFTRETRAQIDSTFDDKDIKNLLNSYLTIVTSNLKKTPNELGTEFRDRCFYERGIIHKLITST